MGKKQDIDAHSNDSPAEKMLGTLIAIEKDLDEAISSFYTWRAIALTLTDDAKVLDRVNLHPMVWLRFLHSLMDTFYMSLGRIFDKNPNNHRFSNLFTNCSLHPEVFSKQQLMFRKMKQESGLSTAQLQEYINQSHSFQIDDLIPLRTQFKECFRVYEEQCYRHRTGRAHSIPIASHVSTLNLTETNSDDIESMLASLYGIHRAIWEMYNNGRKPEIRFENFSTESILRTKPTKGVKYISHHHIVWQVKDMLERHIQ